MRTPMLMMAVILSIATGVSAQVFADVATLYGIANERPAVNARWLDYDNDGDLDILLASNYFHTLLRNDATTFVDNLVFSESSAPSPPPSGPTMFTSIASTAGMDDALDENGVAWGDYDGDGDLDLYATRGRSPNRLYRNEGDEVFTEVASTLGVSAEDIQSLSVSWADYDNDGDLDLFVTANGGKPSKLFRNDGERFLEVGVGSGFVHVDNTCSAVWADYDKDGDLDLFAAIWGGANRLYRNDASGFVDVAQAVGILETGYNRAASWGDFDNDGDLDLYVCKGRRISGENQQDLLYRNENGNFVNISASVGITDVLVSTGADWGDYDNDGDLDLFVTTAVSQPNRLYQNTGGVFVDISAEKGVDNMEGNSQYPSWVDYDNDGDLDLFVTRDEHFSILLYENDNQGFTEVQDEAGLGEDLGWSAGCSWGDFNNDGFPDVYIPNYSGANSFYRNNGNGNHWLVIRTIGTVSNADGIGARIEVVSGARRQIREVGGSDLSSQNSLPVEFGLGTHAVADSVVIQWPSGVQQVLTDVSADQFLTLTEPGERIPPLMDDSTHVFTDVASIYGVADDRPAVNAMWLDYDNDADLDLLVASTVFPRLYRNDGSMFVDVAPSLGLLEANGASSAYVSAGDYENDGDIDMWVTSAGESNLYRNDISTEEGFTGIGHFGSGNLIDYDGDGDLDAYRIEFYIPNRLYRNDDGILTEIPDALGLNDPGHTRWPVWGDYDGDGDMDVYVVNGRGERSSLYRNDVNVTGHFTDVTDQVGVGNEDGGSGGGACWGDYDNDGDLDLYLATSSANRLYRNEVNASGGFKNIGDSLGVAANDFSQSASWADYDNDGDLDLYVVNTEDRPNRLYRNDVLQGGGFAETGEMADGQLDFGGSWGDFDRDGDLDFYLAGGNQGNLTINRLYQNAGNDNHWLHVETVGTLSNRSGIGARIRVVADGSAQVRYVETTSGFGSQNSLPVEFGLGTQAVADSVVIQWPSGVEQILTNISADQFLTVTEPGEGSPPVPQTGRRVFLDNLAVFPGDTISVVVHATEGAEIAAGKLLLHYDPAVLTATSVGQADSTWSAVLAHQIDQEQGIAGATWASTSGIGTDPADLLSVTVVVNPAVCPGDTTRIWISDLSLTDSDAAPLAARSRPGRVRVFGVPGDVNADGGVDIDDAVLCLKVAVGADLPPILPEYTKPRGFAERLADRTGDGVVNARDALRILLDALEGMMPSGMAKLARSTDSPLDLSGATWVAVRADASAQTGGSAADVVIRYDRDQLTLMDAVPSRAGGLMAFHEGEPGVVRLALINTEGLVDEEGIVLRLAFQPKNEGSPAAGWALESMSLYDLDEGLLTDTEESGNEGTAIPTAFALTQNVPNPFNAGTTIRFSVPNTEDGARLFIHDFLGREVRTLGNVPAAAGEYEVIWDGKDKSGREVSSGVYVYWLSVDGKQCTEARKMVLIR
ncbi:MAG: FG-GAP-like repeat-containing protein [Candidatus Latescibacterota bacterium]